MIFQAYQEKSKLKTKQEYMKKGVKVECLGITIYQKGVVWMPTNQKYLLDFVEVLKKMEGDKTVKDILDIGCGSGVLSFLCRKSFKKAKIIGVDCNSAAVDTTNINAAQHHYDDTTAFQFDVRKVAEFKDKLKE